MARGCCLLGIFNFIYAGIRWCIEAGWKGYIVLGVVTIIILVATLQVSGFVCNRGGDSEVVVNPPAKLVAPYMVTTWSRVYYAEEAVQDEVSGDVTMRNYWERDGDEWVQHNVTFVLEGSTYGYLEVKKR